MVEALIEDCRIQVFESDLLLYHHLYFALPAKNILMLKDFTFSILLFLHVIVVTTNAITFSIVLNHLSNHLSINQCFVV